MGFLTLSGLERLWNHIVALVGNKIDSLNLRGSTGAYAIQQTNANDASGFSSIALGGHTTAKGNYSIAMGSSTIAEGEDSIAAGYYSKAIGDNSFAEGYQANANGNYSQAKGYYVNANGTHSTVIGKYNDTPDKSGYYESIGTLYQTFENNSTYTKVIGTPILDTENGYWIFEGTEEVLGSALAIGDYVCNSNNQWRELTSLKSSTSTSRTFNDKRHNIESYNTKQSTYAFAVGNGTSDTVRSNAHTLDWNGNAWFAGDVSVGANNTKLIKEGEEDFVVVFTPGEGGNFICNKAFAELEEVYSKNKNIVAKVDVEGFLGIFSSLTAVINDDGEKGFYFCFDTAVLFGEGANSAVIYLEDGTILPQELPASVIAPLTFTGAVEATYDGTQPLEINIPEGGLTNLQDGTAEGSITSPTSDGGEGVNSFAFNSRVRGDGAIALGSGTGWRTLRQLTCAANSTHCTYWNEASDNPVYPGMLITLDKVNFVRVIEYGETAENGYPTFFTDEPISTTAVNNVEFYAPYGAFDNGSVALGQQATANSYGVAFPASSAFAPASFAAGGGTAYGQYSTALGLGTAGGHGAFAMGMYANASGVASFASGALTRASGEASFARGVSAEANGYAASADGAYVKANGRASRAEGKNTIASGDHQHVQGIYNLNDTEGRYADIVGGGYENHGTYPTYKNISALDWDGNSYFAGDVYVNGNGTTIGFDGAKKVATEEYVSSAIVGLVDTAPEALNTLNELAAALGDDPNFATTVATEIGKKADKTDLVALTEAEILEVCVIST